MEIAVIVEQERKINGIHSQTRIPTVGLTGSSCPSYPRAQKAEMIIN